MDGGGGDPRLARIDWAVMLVRCMGPPPATTRADSVRAVQDPPAPVETARRAVVRGMRHVERAAAGARRRVKKEIDAGVEIFAVRRPR